MKKSLLFVIDSLECAGAEKSLVSLLTLLDYSKYEVDLLLFGYGGPLERLLPREVNLLGPSEYIKFSKMSLKESVVYSIKKNKIKLLLARLTFSKNIRKQKYNNPQIARIYWESTSSVIDEANKKYDIAISYAQGVPTFYVAEKVKAKKKFAWVNASYHLEDQEKQFQKKFYEKFDRIVAVSESAKEIFIKTFPYLYKKMNVIYDINNPKQIYEMADMEVGFDDDYKGTRILTIGRLDHQKGYDIAIEACRLLKDQGVDFRWYSLGKGPLEEEVRKKVKEYDLSGDFILLGVKENPYPYIKNSNIYVQTSRNEGFGLAIAEARMLNIPVVSTKFDAVFSQMIHGKNGLVVEMEPHAVCEGIKKIIENNELKRSIVDYLRTEKKGNVEEIDKFYQLLA
ncbi:group 1 glycosyl transferase [Mycobacteroides abscessus subsp. abscessus]|nr:group 1 glycosyl transferase [Mycobacteroides abscessus subsp. abscessus]